jgi:hypothetical protein
MIDNQMALSTFAWINVFKFQPILLAQKQILGIKVFSGVLQIASIIMIDAPNYLKS